MNTLVRDCDGKFAMTAEDADLLDRVATSWIPGGGSWEQEFLSACKADAAQHAGLVSVNRVRELCRPLGIPARRWSSLWTHNTGIGRPMRKTRRIDEFKGSTNRNDGKPYFYREWVG